MNKSTARNLDTTACTCGICTACGHCEVCQDGTAGPSGTYCQDCHRTQRPCTTDSRKTAAQGVALVEALADVQKAVEAQTEVQRQIARGLDGMTVMIGDIGLRLLMLRSRGF